MDLAHLIDDLAPEALDRALQVRSMHEFIQGAWPTLEPGRHFYDNWHIESICEHLEAVVSGEVRRLIINIPPRHMKSLLCAVAFPCWAWIHKPHLQFLFASYASSLSIRDSVKCRRLLSSDYYTQLNPTHHLTSDQNQKQRFENNSNGHRISTSVGGALTGEGGDIIVIDDPHSVAESESEAVRQSTCEWFDTVATTRLNDPKTGAFVIIMQRVHQSDLTGHIISRAEEQALDEHWVHLSVPAEYESHHPHPFRPAPPTSSFTPQITSDPRTEEGALLWPERIPQNTIDALKISLGSYAAAGQLQQRPAPKGGGILQSKWWRKWEREQVPTYSYLLQSYDTAFEKNDNAAYSARTTWGIFNYGNRHAIMLVEYWRGRVEYPELRKLAKESYQEWSPDCVLIEKKASGSSLLQDLRMAGIPVIPYSPDKDKVARAHSAAVIFEAGLVWYPARRWAEEVIQHAAVFPAGDGADVVDTITQAILRLKSMWFLIPQEDDAYDPTPVDREDDLDLPDNVIPINQKGAIYG